MLALTGGGLFLIAFVFAERQRGDKAMMPLSLFASSGFVGLTVLTFLLYAALGGLFDLAAICADRSERIYGDAGRGRLVAAAAGHCCAGFARRRGCARGQDRAALGRSVIGPMIVAAGFLLTLRIGSGDSYWLGVLPAMVVIAVGMAGAVAPLTTAVLMSVDSHHVGAASGLNSAVARTGGLVATALIGAVMSVAGPALVSAFGVAALVGAAL